MTDVAIDDAMGTPVSKNFPGCGLYSGHVVATAPGHTDRFTVRCKSASPHHLHDPPPRPPRRTRLDKMVYGLCVLLIWILALGEAFTG